MRIQIWLLVATLTTGAAGCSAVLAPLCLRQQHRGQVTAFEGHVAAGEVVSRVVRYDPRGSQDEVHIRWKGQGAAGGPRLWVYATRSTCRDFTPPPAKRPYVARGDCTIIGAGGGFLAADARPCLKAGTCLGEADEIVHTLMIIGGPRNGAPPGFADYALHIVGDAAQPAEYSIAITWFYGPDC